MEVISDEAAFRRTVIGGNEALGLRRPYTAEYINELLDFYLTYEKSFPSIKSKFTVLGGHSYQRFFRATSRFGETDFNGGDIGSQPLDLQSS